MKKILALLFSALLIGCASVYKQHSGNLSGNEIAILEHPSVDAGFIIEDIDGKWRGVGKFTRYELLPGEHVLTVTYYKNGLISGKKLNIQFTAVAGKKYRFEGRLQGMAFTAEVIDVEINTVISKIANF